MDVKERNEDIIRRLVAELKKAAPFPVRIGPRETNLFCVDKEAESHGEPQEEDKAYRLSGQKAAHFPAQVVQELLGVTESELLDALRWVTRKEEKKWWESDVTFFAFIPKDESLWPQD